MDTNVAIYLRDRNPTIISRVAELDDIPAMSVLTRIELEGGVYKEPALAHRRRASLDILIAATKTIDFRAPLIDVYGRIVAQLGYSRRQAIDRMVAATAIAHGLTLITINGEDFRNIAELSLEIWPNPAAQ